MMIILKVFSINFKQQFTEKQSRAGEREQVTERKRGRDRDRDRKRERERQTQREGMQMVYFA